MKKEAQNRLAVHRFDCQFAVAANYCPKLGL